MLPLGAPFAPDYARFRPRAIAPRSDCPRPAGMSRPGCRKALPRRMIAPNRDQPSQKTPQKTSQGEFEMKLVRYGAPGREKPGIVDADGKIRDLSKVVKDIDGAMLAAGGLAKIKKANIKRLKAVSGKPRLGPCIGNVRNFIAIGLNYSDHAAEAGMPIPKEPIIFNKAPTCIVRAQRRHHHPEGFDQARLGSRTRHRHRQARALSLQGKNQGRHRRLFPLQRRVRAQLPDRAFRRPVEQGQRLRDLRADRALVRHQGRDQGRAEPCRCGSTSTARSASAATPRP